MFIIYQVDLAYIILVKKRVIGMDYFQIFFVLNERSYKTKHNLNNYSLLLFGYYFFTNCGNCSSKKTYIFQLLFIHTTS